MNTNEHELDAKTIGNITNVERGQILNYLKITKLRAGLILNFKHPKLEWEGRIGPMVSFVSIGVHSWSYFQGRQPR